MKIYNLLKENKLRFNSLVITSICVLYLISYLFGPIYNTFEKLFPIINSFFLLVLFFINAKEILKDKKSIFFLVFQLIFSIICIFVTGTGIGSVIQIINLNLMLILIPLIYLDRKFENSIKYIIPAFIILFLLMNKSHLNPNFVGYIYLCLYILCVGVYNLDRKDNRFWLILLSLLALLLIYTVSCRTAMLGVFVFLVSLLILNKKNLNEKTIKLMPIGLVFAGFGLAIIYVLLWKFNFQINLRFIVDKGIFSGRNRIWNEIFPLLLKNPVFGIGSKYQLNTHSTFALHNTMFMVALTFGIPSLLIIYFNIKQMLNKFLKRCSKHFSIKILFATIITLFFVDIFESYIYWSNFNCLFFVLSIYFFNRNLEVKKNEKLKSKVVLIEEGVDRMGGVERVISTLANEFSKTHKVEVVSFYKTRNETYFSYDDDIKIAYLTKELWKLQNLKNEKFYKYYFFRLLQKIKDSTILRYKIGTIVNKLNPQDILILGRVDVAIKVLPLLETDVNNIIVRDAIHLDYYSDKKQKKIIKVLQQKATTLIVSSEESKTRYLEKINSTDFRIEKIYNPLGIVPKTEYNYENKIILSVGRYSSQKGFEILVYAFKLIADKYSDWKLKIVGADCDNLRKIIRKLDLEKNVILVNNNKNIVEELNQASIFVMSSRYEGYANALVEALACGVPSITFNWLLGADDIIENDKDGIIVELFDRYEYAKGNDNPIDIVNLAKNIAMLIESKDKCIQFSKKSSKKILSTRDKQKIVQEWYNLINDGEHND